MFCMDTKICVKCQLSLPLSSFRTVKGKYLKRTCKSCMSTICPSCGCKAEEGRICSECYRPEPRNYKSRDQSRTAWLNQCLRSTKACSPSRAKRGYRVKENDLTIEFLLDLWNKQQGICPITGLPLKSKSGDPCSASIDRIDPDRGYLQDNVILACKWANLGRGRCSIEEFRLILASVRLSKPVASGC